MAGAIERRLVGSLMPPMLVSYDHVPTEHWVASAVIERMLRKGVVSVGGANTEMDEVPM